MVSGDVHNVQYSLADLGIVSSTDHQLELKFESSPDLGLGDARILFDPVTKKWKLVPSNVKSLSNGNDRGSGQWKGTSPKSSPTWVDQLPETDHVRFFRAVEWASTPLGATDTWPVVLQTLVNLLMTESMAAAIYWGPQLSAIYNAEMVALNQDRLDRHAQHMGKSFKELWPDQWIQFESMLRDVIEHGVPLDTMNVSLLAERNGGVEETFWTGTFIPIRDLDGNIQGFFNRARETTKEVIAERRTKTLNTIALPKPSRNGSVWKQLFDGFRDNVREFPMAFIYKATEEANARVRLQLEQSIGLPEAGHPLVPAELDLFDGQTGFVPYFRRAKVADQPLLLHKSNNTLPQILVEGFEWQGSDEPSTSLAIIAINASDRLLGMMVVGLNPRRPYDLEYEGFLNSLGRHTSSIITNAMDKEEAKSRAVRLEKQLVESERHIREIAIHGLVGMVQVTPNGKLAWANDQFYELTGHSRNDGDQYEYSFLDIIHPDDMEITLQQWKVLSEEHRRTTTQVRLKRMWKPPPSSKGQEYDEEPAWVTSSAYPSIEDGKLKYIAAAITDISQLKWAERMESRNAATAQEAKRLQENFIDIVSHEMRNPLSAIMQLADGISTSVEDLYGNTTVRKAKAIIDDNVDNAKTILLCAAHQKRIIDDVLTLSKLDSMMLSITPVVVRPTELVQSTLKMFEGEFKTNDITCKTIVDSSFKELNAEWVSLDPSRLTQIFVNLITNAIKFTKHEKTREIKVRSSISPSRPPTVAGVTWFPTQKKYRDLTQGKEWGSGQEIFLCFELSDTGRGLEQEEMQKLFGRFQQATAKTHIKYGGSGLGLFISRELTETQGGEIGVFSKPGEGSTFAFYVKGRIAEAPDEPVKVIPTGGNTSVTIERSLQRESSGDSFESSSIEPKVKRTVILLVEDNVMNARILSRQLERGGCDVHLANHGMEALDFLSKSRAWKHISDDTQAIDIDCILMDSEMPIMDGLTCTRRIRQLEKEGSLIRHINIIAITANARPEQLDTVMSSGADGVMSKPFRVRGLLAKVTELQQKNSTGGE